MSDLSSIERSVVELASDQPMLDQVQDWAAINSGSRNLDGLGRIAETLADAFASLPGQIELIDPAPVEEIDSSGRANAIDHGRNLLVTVRPEASLQLLLTGHMDTVFGADHPFQEQQWLEDGVLGGPGVADMKGGIAVMLGALNALEASGWADGIGYQVLINSDEEVGSPGSAGLLADCARGKRAALTYEPAALPDGTLAGARPGSGNFSLVVHGRSAHAGRNPEDGRNALLAAADLALELEKARVDGLSINPARIDGGSPNNVVPDLAILRVNMRPRRPELEDSASQALREAIARIEAKREVQIELHGGFGRPPKPMTAESQRLFELVRAAGRDLGQAIGWKDSGGVCDGNNIAACGVPVVDTMGVRGGKIHSMEEFLIVDSLKERAELSALTIMRLAGSAE